MTNRWITKSSLRWLLVGLLLALAIIAIGTIIGEPSGSNPGPMTLTGRSQCIDGRPVNTLTWTESAGASSYQIYREVPLIATGPGGTLTYEDRDASLEPGRRTHYSVGAVNSVGVSYQGVEIDTARCGGSSSSLTITGDSRCVAGQSVINLTWTLPAPPPASAVHTKIVRNSAVLAENLPGSLTTYRDTAVTAGVLYDYLVSITQPGSPAQTWQSSHLQLPAIPCIVSEEGGVRVEGDIFGLAGVAGLIVDPSSVVVAGGRVEVETRNKIEQYQLTNPTNWPQIRERTLANLTRLRRERTRSLNAVLGVPAGQTLSLPASTSAPRLMNLNPVSGNPFDGNVLADPNQPEGGVWLVEGNLEITAPFTFANIGTLMVTGSIRLRASSAGDSIGVSSGGTLGLASLGEAPVLLPTDPGILIEQGLREIHGVAFFSSIGKIRIE